MKLKDILAISGEGTLFKFIAQGKNAIIVENLETGRRVSAGGTSKVSALDEISIYTTEEDMPLSKVMDRIWEKEAGKETISHKSPDAELKKYFADIMPEYNRDRVYTSDIKKVLHWYNLLHKFNLLVQEEEGAAEEEKAGEGEEPVTAEEPKAETKAKKASAPKEEKSTAAKGPKNTSKKK